MNIPKTPKGILNKITRIRKQMSDFKRVHNFIDDGGGARYYLFYLYLLFGDNRKSSAYIKWYEKQFPDDSGEPLSLLCWALILHRMGRSGDYKLKETMLSNIYLIPHLIGEESNMVDYIPERILENITEDELDWIKEIYTSESFQKILKRHIEIEKELEHTPVGPYRSKLVDELYNLL